MVDPSGVDWRPGGAELVPVCGYRSAVSSSPAADWSVVLDLICLVLVAHPQMQVKDLSLGFTRNRTPIVIYDIHKFGQSQQPITFHKRTEHCLLGPKKRGIKRLNLGIAGQMPNATLKKKKRKNMRHET